MFKKVDFDEEIICIKEKGIAAWTGSISNRILTVCFSNGELSEYYFPTYKEYSKFNHKLRKIYQEE